MTLWSIREKAGLVPLLSLDTRSPFARRIREHENVRIIGRRICTGAVVALVACALWLGL